MNRFHCERRLIRDVKSKVCAQKYDLQLGRRSAREKDTRHEKKPLSAFIFMPQVTHGRFYGMEQNH